MAPRAFHYSFHASDRQTRPGRGPHGDPDYSHALHEIRDQAGFIELVGPLADAGFSFGDTLLNLPCRDNLPPRWPLSAAPRLGPGDLLVVTTRIPLDDHRNDHDPSAIAPRKKIVPGDGTLHRSILSTTRSLFLETCDRTQVAFTQPLTDAYNAACPHNPLDRLFFLERRGVFRMGHSEKAAGFAFAAPHLVASDGNEKLRSRRPRLLAVFGMGGVEGWMWSRFLRRRRQTLLRKMVTDDHLWFVFGRWDPVHVPPRPASLAFTDYLNPELFVASAKVVPTEAPEWQPCR